MQFLSQKQMLLLSADSQAPIYFQENMKQQKKITKKPSDWNRPEQSGTTTWQLLLLAKTA